MSSPENRDRYQQWAEHVRSQNRGSATQAIQDLRGEIGQLTRQLQESQESPKDIQAEICRLELRVSHLTQRTQQLSEAIAHAQERNRRTLREQIQATLSRCDDLMAAHKQAADIEVLRDTDKMLGLSGHGGSLIDCSSREVEKILHDSTTLPRLRRSLEEQAAQTHKELAATAAALPEMRQRGEKQQELADQIAALEGQLKDVHGVSPQVVEAVRKLRADGGFRAFCQQQTSDAQRELEWDLPKDVLAQPAAATLPR